jgi:hypothetical protein
VLLRAAAAAALRPASGPDAGPAEEDRAFPARDGFDVRFLGYDGSLDDAARR